MPNAINPNDYNIDKLNTGFLGPMLTTDFRDYVLNHNLQNINDEVVSHGYNLGGLNIYAGDLGLPTQTVQDLPGVVGMATSPNVYTFGQSPQSNTLAMNIWSSSAPYQQSLSNVYSQSSQPLYDYEVKTTIPLVDPGNVSAWKSGTGLKTSNELMEEMINSRKLYSDNSYGPEFISAYNCPDMPMENTGFIQYKTFAGGDFRSTIIGRQLGFGVASGIEYESDLSDIGSSQRQFNLKERIKLNFIGDTIGRVNLDPFGLLAGQDVYDRDYTITEKSPGSTLDKAGQFLADLSGFNLPKSNIPTTPYTKDGQPDLLNYTGEGQKSLLYNALSENRWGPSQMGEKAAQPFDKPKKNDGEPPTMIKYTDSVEGDFLTDAADILKNLPDSLPLGPGGGAVNVTKSGNKIYSDKFNDKSYNPDDPTQDSENKGYNLTDYTYDDERIGDHSYKFNSSRFKTSDIPMGNASPGAELVNDGDNLIWKHSGNSLAKRGLLRHTQELINKGIGDKKSSARFIGAHNDASNFTNGTDGGKHTNLSMGNTVKSKDGTVYCRSWSVSNTYDKFEDTIRHKQLTRDLQSGGYSILEDNGMPKIVPYSTDIEGVGDDEKFKGDASRYMLSLENLAWEGSDEWTKLPPIEKGPNKGRLMWFPPYNLSFTDNTSVNWETTDFIGRAEPIYTYNNTERTGNLTFTVIMDNPSVLQTMRTDDSVTGALERFFAGCDDDNDPIAQMAKTTEVVVDETTDPKPLSEPKKPPFESLTYFFENAASSSSPIGRNVSTDFNNNYESDDKNQGFSTNIDALVEFLLSDDGKRYKIKIEGHTSCLSNETYNLKLSKDRAESFKEFLYLELLSREASNEYNPKPPTNVDGDEGTYPTVGEWEIDPKRWVTIDGKGEVGCQSYENYKSEKGIDTGYDNLTNEQKQEYINSNIAKEERTAILTLEHNPEIDGEMLKKATEDTSETKKRREKEVSDSITRKAEQAATNMLNEAAYFEKVKTSDSFVYNSLKESVQHFHPAFHSMTPEGFNSRLTFLQQCTRQGPNVANNEPQNMAFGKPPICILRVGDFYHTKIVIDTVNFTFDPLQWDLNPEGVGVQPMLCTVDLNFKFIGGSSLGGPIKQLQNAVSFNFFANAGVYNPRKLYNATGENRLGKGDKFGYGAFITPSQPDSEDVDNLILTEEEENDVISLQRKDKADDAKKSAIDKSERDKIEEAEKKKSENKQKLQDEFASTIVGNGETFSDFDLLVISTSSPYKFRIDVSYDKKLYMVYHVSGKIKSETVNASIVGDGGTTITLVPLSIGDGGSPSWRASSPSDSTSGVEEYNMEVFGKATLDGEEYEVSTIVTFKIK